MTIGRATILFFAAVLVAIIVKMDKMASYEREATVVAELACDVVTTRAQAGSTRDVYDQIFSFLRKHSPDPRTEVVIRSGGREIGSRTTGEIGARIEHVCKIQNAGDYEIEI